MSYQPHSRDGCSNTIHIGNIFCLQQRQKVEDSHILPPKKIFQKFQRLLFTFLHQNLVSQAHLDTGDAGKGKKRMNIRSVASWLSLSRGRTFLSAYLCISTTCMFSYNQTNICWKKTESLHEKFPLSLGWPYDLLQNIFSLSHDCKTSSSTETCNVPTTTSPFKILLIFSSCGILYHFITWFLKEPDPFCLLTTWN